MSDTESLVDKKYEILDEEQEEHITEFANDPQVVHHDEPSPPTSPPTPPHVTHIIQDEEEDPAYEEPAHSAVVVDTGVFDDIDDDISLDPDYHPEGTAAPQPEEHDKGINWNPLGLNLNPLGLNLNPLGLNLNPLNLDFNNIADNLNPLNPIHRERMQYFFNGLQTGTTDLNDKMHGALVRMRSPEYKQKMNTVLNSIKNTKEYQSSTNTDYDVVFESVDMYTDMHMDVLAEKEAMEGNFLQKIKHWTRGERISTLLFIPILGLLIGTMGLICDLILIRIIKGQQSLLHLTNFWWANAFAFIAYSVFLSFLSASCISFISPYAVGSGIPELKSIMSGIDLSRVLSRRTLLSKVVGMLCAVGAGLTVGRTGPFMHASAIIAHQMMQMRIFSNIRKNLFSRYQMLTSALAAGVTANFGAPIGGLLFAIEVTGTNSFFGALWKGFLCATMTAVVFELSRGLTGGIAFAAVYKFEFLLEPYGFVELMSFVAVGIFCGLLGALFVFLFEKMVRFRLKYPILRTSRIGVVTIVAACSSMIIYASGPVGQLPLSKAMLKLIHNDPIDFQLIDSFLGSLGIFIMTKFFLTIFNVILPIPGGAISPFLVIGAGLGRVYGEILNRNVANSVIVPAGYAVIGAAGLCSGTIRAISPAVFILELTGQLGLLIPVLICSITAAAVGNLFNKPLFDTALKIQNLPFLSNFRSEKVYRMSAKDVMMTNIHYISMESTVGQILSYLERHDERFVPLVQSGNNMILEGIAERKSLKFVIDDYITGWKQKHNPEGDAVLASDAHPNDEPGVAELDELDENSQKIQKEENKEYEETLLADVMTESESAVLIDFAPSQIPEATPLNKVFHLFVMLGLGFTFVTRYGSLVGVITKKDLMKREL